MATVRAALKSTKRAFSRSCAPFLPSQENGSARIFSKTSEEYLKMFAISLVIGGVSASTYCSMKLADEKTNCKGFKRLYSAVYSEPEAKDAEDHHVSVEVKN